MKEKIKILLAILITAILSIGTTATALLVTRAENITLNSSKTTKQNVKDSLDEIYTNINNLVQCNKDENGNYKCPKCIRTTKLHTETCNQNNNARYCSSTITTSNGSDIKNGSVITYGNTNITKWKCYNIWKY